jgi:hypothetical protein
MIYGDLFVKSDGKKEILLPFLTKIGLNDRILSKNSSLKRYILEDYRYGKKRRLSAWEVFSPRGLSKTHKRKLILFPSYRAGGNVRLKSISRGTAMKRLLQDTPIYMWQKNRVNAPEKTLRSLCDFIKGAETFELLYNDVGLKNITSLIEKKLKCG